MCLQITDPPDMPWEMSISSINEEIKQHVRSLRLRLETDETSIGSQILKVLDEIESCNANSQIGKAMGEVYNLLNLPSEHSSYLHDIRVKNLDYLRLYTLNVLTDMVCTWDWESDPV